tara:strand:+ start:114 stop:485 length:372 start_codon:yes stop_codon:yes gene_type:complete
MTEFKFTVLLIAIIALIIGLTSIAVLLSRGDYISEWPPFISKCPDQYTYTIDTNDNDNSKCTTDNEKIHSSGNATIINKPCSEFYPNNGTFTGTQGNCNKKKWAEECQVSWDGIRGNEDLCDF